MLFKNKDTMRCNKCGKTLLIENGILKEDVFEAAKDWGFFSKKDLESHKFNVCEVCYDEFVAGFVIPVEVSDKKEAL